MRIKGTAFLSKKRCVTRIHGEARWDNFIAKLAAEIPFFREPVLATTLIPAETFLAFQDRMLATFFAGDEHAYWEIGARSADWALSEGPYKHYIVSRDIPDFVARFPSLWSTYFTTSEAKTSMSSNVIDVYASGLPRWHGYFEYMVMGYFKRALELQGARVTLKRVTPARARDFHYQFILADKDSPH
jgi:hypothetical protein